MHSFTQPGTRIAAPLAQLVYKPLATGGTFANELTVPPVDWLEMARPIQYGRIVRPELVQHVRVISWINFSVTLIAVAQLRKCHLCPLGQIENILNNRRIYYITH